MTDPAYAAPCGSVAYQGGPGAFSEAAAQQLIGPDVPLRPCRTFAGVFEALRSGEATEAVLPVENVLWGPVEAVQQGIALLPHTVVDELWMPIQQALIAPPGVAFGAIRRVRSHPVALGQCRRFFADHPGIEAVEDDDTGLAVERVVRQNRGDEAAIGAAHAAALFGGVVLRPSVQDHSDNRTRFLWIRTNG
ncbi:MAG: hypothetical protein IAE99_11930 [Rhodothermales bacterium]|nr:hypothetical protein [Rhodothermales bacterium]